MRTLAGFTLTLAALALMQQPSFGQYPYYRPDGFAVPQAPQAPQFFARQTYGSYAPNGYYSNNGYGWPMPQQQMMPQGMYPPQMYQPYNWQNQSNMLQGQPPQMLTDPSGFAQAPRLQADPPADLKAEPIAAPRQAAEAPAVDDAPHRLFRWRERHHGPAPCPAPETPERPPQRPEERPPTERPPATEAEPTFAPEQFAAGRSETINMMGDLLSGPTSRCVTIVRTVQVPVTHTFTLPPVLVPPMPFTFTPVATAQPPGILITPPPFTLPNGTVVQPPPFLATPAPVTLTFPQTTVTLPAFQAPPPPLMIQTLQTVTLQELKCSEILSAAARASSFKIAEDESPIPQDRVYFGFNYFDDVNRSVNERLGGNVGEMRIYRETFGIEKTFLDKHASIELRAPFATLDVASDVPGLGGSQTDWGDLSVNFKYAPYLDLERGNAIALGLVVTTPTAASEFNPFHDCILQPFAGYKWTWGNLFLHGFLSLGVPTDSRDVTLLFNDVGIGYFAYRNADHDAWVSAIVPTVECHVDTPLNHRGAFNFDDATPTADVVTITTGATCVIRRQATLAVGAGVPVTGPKPYSFELLVQLNYHY